MGVSQISLIVSKLISNGINENEKVTLIQKCIYGVRKNYFFTSLKKNVPCLLKKIMLNHFNNCHKIKKNIKPEK